MTTKNFFFSIVVPALNEEKNLPCLFDSLKNQTLDVPYQVVISDNGSTDCTIEVTKKLGGQVATGSTKGCIGSARFVGAELAEKLAKNSSKHEEIIIFTDADSWVEKNYFQTVFEAYQNPKVSASMGPVVYEQGKYSFKVGKFSHPVCLTSAAADLRAWWILK
ncbi:MAG: glycosyltransferase family A protein, partial [bacterium]|nr:glycosyltransferase family A protein [bacterium]